MKLNQDGVEIKPIALLTEEENLTDINGHNIVEIIKEFPNPMIDPLDPPTDKEVTDINVSNNGNKFDRQNF